MALDSKGKPLPSREVAASVLRMMAPRVAIKAKPTSDSRSSAVAVEEHSSKRPRVDKSRDKDPMPNANQMGILISGMAGNAVAEAPAFREFSISLNMAGKMSLGIDVDWADGRTLLVKSVQMGPVADWNMDKGADKALRPGDRIVAVNGVSGDSIGAVAMVQECKGKPHVLLTCRTQRPRPQHLLARPFVPVPVATEVTTGSGKAQIEDAAKKGKKKSGSLYSFLPEPDPENDETAVIRAKELDPFAEPAAKETKRLMIFLDIDGVLRRQEGRNVMSVDGEVLPLHLLTRKFEPEAVRALKWLVHKTGAGIVLSSEWRRDSTLRDEVGGVVRMAGLPPMRGETPVLEPREEVAIGPPNTEEREKGPKTMRLRWAERRAREISDYLRDRPEVKRWVALDDLDLSLADSFRIADTLWMGPGLVLVNPDDAFTMGDARKASEMLLEGHVAK